MEQVKRKRGRPKKSEQLARAQQTLPFKPLQAAVSMKEDPMDADVPAQRSLPWDFDLAQAIREYLMASPSMSDKELFERLEKRFKVDLSHRHEFIKLVAEALSC